MGHLHAFFSLNPLSEPPRGLSSHPCFLVGGELGLGEVLPSHLPVRSRTEGPSNSALRITLE